MEADPRFISRIIVRAVYNGLADVQVPVEEINAIQLINRSADQQKERGKLS